MKVSFDVWCCFGHYRYDGNGERFYKMTGQMLRMNVSGWELSYPWCGPPTLYASPYLVATPQGYTKHYYAGMDRIASRIGGGGLIELGMEPWELDMKKQQVTDAAYRFYEEDLGLRDMDIVENLSVLYEYEGRVHDGHECYFYHTDQIGSSNWITNQDGQPVQHLQYLPFGEPWIDQRVSEWNSRYTFYPEFIEGFSGKERDRETGLSYFGARYYDSDLSIWLSADPLAHKYPHLSSYVYCSDNPIGMVDPDGRKIIPANRQSAKYMKGYLKEIFGTNRMFYFSGGELKIRNSQFNKYYNNTNEYRKELLDGFKEAISVSRECEVAITKDKGVYRFTNYNAEGYGPYVDLSTNGGGVAGRSSNMPFDMVLVNDQKANEQIYNTGSLTIGDIISIPSYIQGRASDVFVHEVLDEFLNHYVKRMSPFILSPEGQAWYQNLIFKDRNQKPRIDHEQY